MSSVVHADKLVPVSAARLKQVLGSRRACRSVALAALTLFAGSEGLQNAVANGDTRTISMRHIHTGESLTITYKKDGRYDDEALDKLNWLLRDWRRNEKTRMDPATIDIVWEVYREVGGKEPIEIICGYRAPATNAMLRRRSRGVAQFSQHTLGKAIDYYIPGVPLEDQREAGLRLQRGGVGYYPSSGSPFVHMDTGNVRHWPRLPEAVYARVLRSAPKIQVASASKPKKTIAAAYNPSDEDDDGESVSAPRSNAKTADAKTQDVTSADAKPVRVAAVPMPNARPASAEKASFTVASADARSAPAPSPRPAQAASLFASPQNADLVAARGYWDAVSSEDQTRPQAAGAQVASLGAIPQSAARETTGSLTPGAQMRGGRADRVPSDVALGYASDNMRLQQHARRAAVNSGVGNVEPVAGDALPSQRPAAVADVQGPTTVIEKAAPGAASQGTTNGRFAASYRPVPGERFDDPWLRAAMWASSVTSAMTATPVGELDLGELSALMRKPVASLMMSFSSDPHQGLTTEHFTGGAVVFLSTVTFASPRTAGLR